MSKANPIIQKTEVGQRNECAKTNDERRRNGTNEEMTKTARRTRRDMRRWGQRNRRDEGMRNERDNGGGGRGARRMTRS
eukprot:9470103-Pyramimonas_sp.AAC.1